MSTCSKCNSELNEGAKFCSVCGAKVAEMISCPNCGAQIGAEAAFCDKCGASLSANDDSSTVTFEAAVTIETTEPAEPAETVGPAETTEPTEPTEEEKKSPLKKILLFGGIGIVVIVAIVVLLTMMPASIGAKDYGLYFKDNEIYYTDFSEDGEIEVSTRLLSGESLTDEEQAFVGSEIGGWIVLNDAGTRIFFPDRIDWSVDGMTLYYRDLDDSEADPIKIDSDVNDYIISADGKQIVYTKGSDNILYLKNLEEDDKEKIASGIISYDVTEGLKKVGYLTEENSYYVWTAADGEKVKLAGDISSIEYLSEDLNEMYYLKDGSLYKQIADSDDKEKIASDVYGVLNIYETGEIYYTKEETTTINGMDYVDDDMAAHDASITEPSYPSYPDYPDYPYWWDYNTDAEYEAALDAYESAYYQVEAEYYAAVDAYNAAWDVYYEKAARDMLRDDLRNETIESTRYSLYYYNGTEETLVTDMMVGGWNYEASYNEPLLVTSIYNETEVTKVKMSEFDSADALEAAIEAAFETGPSSSDLYLVIGTTLYPIDNTAAEVWDFCVSNDGNSVYFVDDIAENGHGDLYKIEIEKGIPSAPEMYDSDVYEYGIYWGAEDQLVYYKNVNEEGDKGDLFINTVEIDYDVEIYSDYFVDDAVLYYTDWNAEKGYGTLTMFKDETSTKIADDVHDFAISYGGDIVYLYDYSTNYYTGTLYLYKNGESQKLDDDVTALIHILW